MVSESESLPLDLTDNWNPLDKTASITLSNTNKTADRTDDISDSSGQPWGAVRSVIGHAGGKWYFEMIVSEQAGFSSLGITRADIPLEDDPNSLENNGEVGTPGIFNSPLDGDVEADMDGVTTVLANVNLDDLFVGCAVDLDANLIWYKVEGHDWNGNPAADPTTGVGGLDMAFARDLEGEQIMHVFAGLGNGAGSSSAPGENTGSAIVNLTGDPGWNLAKPAGFRPWNSEGFTEAVSESATATASESPTASEPALVGPTRKAICTTITG